MGADPEGKIGESHNPETHLIPLILDAASGDRKGIWVFGTDYETPDGTCVRDYIHVVDIAQAHILALKHLESGGESDFFNIGNERGSSVKELIKSVMRVTGKTFPIIPAERRAGDPAILVGSSEKIKKVLGWEPKHPGIDEIVSHAWQWHEHKSF